MTPSPRDLTLSSISQFLDVAPGLLKIALQAMAEAERMRASGNIAGAETLDKVPELLLDTKELIDRHAQEDEQIKLARRVVMQVLRYAATSLVAL